MGHSRAGLIISEVAERVPEKIDFLIYLSAFLLKDGQTLNEVAQQADDVARTAEAVTFHENGMITVSQEGVGQFLYNMTPEPFVRIARERMLAGPVAAFVTPIHVTEARYGSVRRVYIECRHDRAIPLETQLTLQEAVTVTASDRLDGGQSPFFWRRYNWLNPSKTCGNDHRFLGHSEACYGRIKN